VYSDGDSIVSLTSFYSDNFAGQAGERYQFGSLYMFFSLLRYWEATENVPMLACVGSLCYRIELPKCNSLVCSLLDWVTEMTVRR
jgi:hypothetical protein